MELDEYQRLAHLTDESKRAAVSLYGLAGEVGSIFSVFKKRLRDKPPIEQINSSLEEELGDALWYLSSLASLHQISLSKLALANLRKAQSLFQETPVPFFDDDFPLVEQFPRHMRFNFYIDIATKRAIMELNGAPLGDALSDNVFESDDYKFHDVLHLAFLTHLHWSPVIRRLMKKKRKSIPAIDENEDGREPPLPKRRYRRSFSPRLKKMTSFPIAARSPLA